MFPAPRLIACFHAVWGVRRSEEKRRLGRNAQKILHVLRKGYATMLAPGMYQLVADSACGIEAAGQNPLH